MLAEVFVISFQIILRILALLQTRQKSLDNVQVTQKLFVFSAMLCNEYKTQLRVPSSYCNAGSKIACK